MNIIKNAEVDHFIKEMHSSGIDYFSVGFIKKDEVFALFSCPKWQEFYLESECFEFDPLVKTALLNIDIPIDWLSVTVTHKRKSFVMQMREELTGCKEGFSVVKKMDDDTVAILAFGTRKTFPQLVDAYFKHQNQLLKLMETINTELP